MLDGHGVKVTETPERVEYVCACNGFVSHGGGDEASRNEAAWQAVYHCHGVTGDAMAIRSARTVDDLIASA